MKLLTKLTLFTTLSKLAIVALFILLLPAIGERISGEFTNLYLHAQKKKVMKAIEQNGIGYYMEDEEGYGSYTMLKEEYIALEPVDPGFRIDTIETSRRIVEQDTLNYRVLSHTFTLDNNNYLLEIGRTTDTIGQYNKSLRRVALYVLIGLTLVTLLIDLLFTRYMLSPLGKIIKTKLLNRTFPFNENVAPIKTSTRDFKYLDNAFIELMDQVHEAFVKEREFTSNASHELMTPISILQNKIENMVMDEQLDESVHHKLIDMMRTLNRLKKIVSSLLLISRIENDQFTRNGKYNPGELINDIRGELDHRLEEKQLSFSTRLREDIRLCNLNRDLIFQLLYNLVNNAIRYNKPFGSIRIDDSLVGNKYSISIKDTGVGIPPDEIENIYDRFKKVNKQEGEGYGLGLSIVKSIAQYHGIEIEVKSVLAKGTEFTLHFPPEMMSRSVNPIRI